MTDESVYGLAVAAVVSFFAPWVAGFVGALLGDLRQWMHRRLDICSPSRAALGTCQCSRCLASRPLPSCLRWEGDPPQSIKRGDTIKVRIVSDRPVRRLP